MNDQIAPIIKVAVNVFLIRNNKILFGKRIGKSGLGTWCLPGGHLEFSESLEKAAKRELLEETGISHCQLKLLQIINDPKATTHYVHINFLAQKWEGEPKIKEPDKFSQWQWFDLKRLPERIFGGHSKFVPAYLKKIMLVD